MLSLDARVLVRPGGAYRSMAATSQPPGVRQTIRRPLFLALTLACIASFTATSTFTLRIVASAIIYWAYVPAIEMLALAIVTARRRPTPFSAAVDAYFAGHAAWIVCLIVTASVIVFAPTSAWTFLTTAGVGLVLGALVWSAYVDFCFFRFVLRRSAAAAWRDLLLIRLIVWPMVAIIFAVPTGTLVGVFREIGHVITEITR